jgi:hypothetical protein
VFTWQCIGYPRDVEPDAADPPGQPAQRADERNGLRGLSGKDQAEASQPTTVRMTKSAATALRPPPPNRQLKSQAVRGTTARSRIPSTAL